MVAIKSAHRCGPDRNALEIPGSPHSLSDPARLTLQCYDTRFFWVAVLLSWLRCVCRPTVAPRPRRMHRDTANRRERRVRHPMNRRIGQRSPRSGVFEFPGSPPSLWDPARLTLQCYDTRFFWVAVLLSWLRCVCRPTVAPRPRRMHRDTANRPGWHRDTANRPGWHREPAGVAPRHREPARVAPRPRRMHRDNCEPARATGPTSNESQNRSKVARSGVLEIPASPPSLWNPARLTSRCYDTRFF